MKNRIFKSLASLFLAILMVATLLPAMVVGTFAAEVTGTFEKFTGNELVEGDYIITYGTYALGNTVVSSRLANGSDAISGNSIVNPDGAIVWHIAPTADKTGWTIYNADVESYAAGTGAKSKAQLLTDATDTKAQWTVTVNTDGTVDFVNVANAAADVNKTLRQNGTFGFACYATSTGGALTLYKLQEAKHEHSYACSAVGTDGSHTLTCANTDGKCDALTTTEACTWVGGSCSVCGAAAPECDHLNTTEVAEVPATCTEGGYTAGKKCDDCGAIISGLEEIVPTGHTVEIDAAVDATCTETGLTEGSHCSVCDDVLVAQTEVAALGHTYENGTCTECGEAQPTKLTIARNEFGTASEYAWHSWTATATTGETISGSGFIYGTTTTSIQVNGSKAGDYIYNTTALPGKIVSITLTKASGSDRSFDILTSDTPFDSATAASLKGQATDAKKTVTTEGVTWTFETNHKYFAIVIVDKSAAYLSSIEIEYFVCNHTNTTAIGTPSDATCTEDGITAGEKCADCGEVITQQETIPATGHTDTNPADSKCDTCGTNLCTEHVWVDGDVIDEPTCTKTGLQAQYCSVCQEPNPVDKILDKVDHTPETDAAVDATCTATGLTEGSHCSVCGETLVAQTEVPMADHDYVDNKCTVCGDIFVTGDKLAGFEFGDNGNEEHKDGSLIDGSAYTSGTYSLKFDPYTNVYGGAFDALGNSALKLGTSSKAGSFTFTVAANVNTVVLYVAGYKTNTAKLNINGTVYTITSTSDTGAYTKIVVDTTDNKTVTLTTLSGGYRAMINSIEFWGKAVAPAPVNTQYSITLGGDIGLNIYYNVDAAWLAANTDAKLNVNGTLYALVAGENVFTFRVAPTQLATEFTYYIDGDATNSKTVSVNTYIAAAKDFYASDANLLALLTAIETYGSAASTYATNGTATRVDGSALDFSTIADTAAGEGATAFGQVSAVLHSLTTLRIYFAEGFDLTGYTYTLTVGGKTIVTDADLSAAVSGNALNIKNIPAYMLDSAVELSITKDGETQTLTTSVMSYVKSAIGGEVSDALYNLLVAITTYNQAANAYFGA